MNTPMVNPVSPPSYGVLGRTELILRTLVANHTISVAVVGGTGYALLNGGGADRAILFGASLSLGDAVGHSLIQASGLSWQPGLFGAPYFSATEAVGTALGVSVLGLLMGQDLSGIGRFALIGAVAGGVSPYIASVITTYILKQPTPRVQ